MLLKKIGATENVMLYLIEQKRLFEQICMLENPRAILIKEIFNMSQLIF